MFPSTGYPVQDNPFTNEGESGSQSPSRSQSLPASPTPAPSVQTSAPSQETALPRPENKPDVLVQMSREECRRLLRRHDFTSAEYVPGVDVRGNSVKSADLEGTLTAEDVLPKEIAFELALNPLSFAGNSNLETVFSNSSTNFGTIKFDLASGALTFNGKRIDGTMEDEMLVLCRQALSR